MSRQTQGESTLPVIDRGVLKQLALDAGETMSHLVSVFVREGAKQRARIEAALAACDRPTLIREFHTLKSTAATFGAQRLRALAASLESGAGSLDWTDIAAALPELEALRDEAVATIRLEWPAD